MECATDVVFANKMSVLRSSNPLQQEFHASKTLASIDLGAVELRSNVFNVTRPAGPAPMMATRMESFKRCCGDEVPCR